MYGKCTGTVTAAKQVLRRKAASLGRPRATMKIVGDRRSRSRDISEHTDVHTYTHRAMDIIHSYYVHGP